MRKAIMRDAVVIVGGCILWVALRFSGMTPLGAALICYPTLAIVWLRWPQ